MLSLSYQGLHRIKGPLVNNRLMLVFNYDPFLLRPFTDNPELKTVNTSLRSNGSIIYRILQQIFDHAEIPNILSVLGIHFLKLREGIS